MREFDRLAAAIMILAITVIFKNTLEPVKTKSTCGSACQRDVNIMWRVILGFGAVPLKLSSKSAQGGQQQPVPVYVHGQEMPKRVEDSLINQILNSSIV